MPTIIEKACRGNVEAMRALYDLNKRETLFLCRVFLGNEKEAACVVPQIFKKMWEMLLSGQVQSEEEFRRVSIRKTVNYCRASIAGKDPKAFRMPAGRNFAGGEYEMDLGKEAYTRALKGLPPLYRFLYVLHGVCGCESGKTAKWFRIKKERAGLILDSEDVNLSRAAMEEVTAEEFHRLLRKKQEETSVPEKEDREVLETIEKICRPIRERESRRRKKLGFLSAAAAALVCLVIVLAVLLTGGNGEEAAQTTAAETTASETAAAETTASENAAAEETSGTEETAEQQENTGAEETESQSVSQVEADYYADIEIQDHGTVTVALDASAAPETVANFVSLAESGFYDGLTFHRIIDGFMMQGGDPNGDGTGGSETTIKGEFSENGVENPLSHTRGAVSMARSEDYDSASSQFFIVQEDSVYLDGQYAVFGYVTEGMDIVDEICGAAEPADDNGTIPAEEQPVITSIAIREGEEA